MLIGFFLDPANPSDRTVIEQNLRDYWQQTTGVNEEALHHILSTTSGRNTVGKAAQTFAPDQRFTRADLARVLNTDEATVFAWIRQLGRPETRYGISVFERHDDGSYSLSQAMHAAVTRILNAQRP